MWCPRKAKAFVTGVTRVFVSESSNPNCCLSSAATAAFSFEIVPKVVDLRVGGDFGDRVARTAAA